MTMAYGCGALLGDVLYVAGGLERPDAPSALRKFWALDLRVSQPHWDELEPWPGSARLLPVAAVQGGVFFSSAASLWPLTLAAKWYGPICGMPIALVQRRAGA